MHAISLEIEDLQLQLDELRELPSLLEEAASRQAEIAEAVGASNREQQRLEEVTATVTALGVELSVIERTTDTLRQWQLRAQALANGRPALEEWPTAEQPSQYAKVRDTVDGAVKSLSTLSQGLDHALAHLSVLAEDRTRARLDAQDEARSLRRKLDQVQQGFGEASRRVAEIPKSSRPKLSSCGRVPTVGERSSIHSR
jgi:chromosome segregation ATPase